LKGFTAYRCIRAISGITPQRLSTVDDNKKGLQELLPLSKTRCAAVTIVAVAALISTEKNHLIPVITLLIIFIHQNGRNTYEEKKIQ